MADEDAATFNTAATVYDKHVGRYTGELGRALVEVARVQPGMQALDVGCGPGALTSALARVLGPDRVAAIDPSKSFIDACRQRQPGVDVRLGSAEELPFGDGEFDAVVSQLVINFLPDAPRGVREMRRVLRDGGVLAGCVWDYAEGMTMLRAFWDAAVALDPERASSLDEGRRMPYCTEPDLGELFSDAGLDEVRTGELTVAADYAGFDDFWAPFPSGLAPSGDYCKSLEPAAREALRAEVHRRLGSPTGPFRLTARAWYAAGRA